MHFEKDIHDTLLNPFNAFQVKNIKIDNNNIFIHNITIQHVHFNCNLHFPCYAALSCCWTCFSDKKKMYSKCIFCNLSDRKIPKSNQRNLNSDCCSGVISHLQTAHAITVPKDSFICKKDFLRIVKEKKNCQLGCCRESDDIQANGFLDDNHSEGTKSTVNKMKVKSLKTIAATQARCVICRREVDKKCTIIPQEARLDILLEHSILIPDKSRICLSHLNGTHALPGLQIFSQQRDTLSDSEVNEALTILLQTIQNTVPNSINFDGDMDYKTWTGKVHFLMFYTSKNSIGNTERNN